MTDAARLGHNKPPEPTPLERAGDLVATTNQWIKEVASINNDELAGRAQGLVDQLRDEEAALLAQLKVEREPLDMALYILKLRFKDPLALIGIAKRKLGELLTPWLQAKKDRLLAEAAERERAADEATHKANAAIERAVVEPSVEADLAAQRATEDALKAEKAAAKPAGRAQIKGDYSERAMSLRVYWHAEVTNESLALRSMAKEPEVRAAALIAAKRLANKMARELKRADAAPPGFRFFSSEKAT
jgi:hypothetical protein